MKTTEGGGVRGFDAGKKVKARKRHIVCYLAMMETMMDCPSRRPECLQPA